MKLADKILKLNVFAILIIALVAISSCFNSRHTTVTNPHMNDHVVKTDTVHENHIKKDTITEPKLNLKEEYSISVLLPFMLDTLDVYSLDAKKNDLPRATETSLEYYEGALMALDDLKKEGFKAKVHVYDTQTNSYNLTEIMGNPDFAKSDLIIGPLGDKSVQTVADFASKNKIYMVSPVAEAPDSKSDPYLISLNPSLETHCAGMLEYIYKTYPEDNVLMISNVADKGSDLINAIKAKSFEINKKDTISNLSTSVYIKNNDVEDRLMLTKKNIILVPSGEEAFVSSVIRILDQLAKDYDITVFGLPNWMDFETIRMDHFQKLDLHISDPFYLSPTDMIQTPLYQQYSIAYQAEPGENVFRGYDSMLYFGKLLQSTGLSFVDFLNEEKFKKGLYDPFTILPATNPTTQAIDYYENKHVDILELKDYQLIKAQ